MNKPTNPATMRAWRAANPEKVAAQRARYAAKNAEKIRERKRKYKLDNPEKIRAHSAVGTAIRWGGMVKPTHCACGSDHHIHAHHEDYSKPLEVMWLCAACHSRQHHG